MKDKHQKHNKSFWQVLSTPTAYLILGVIYFPCIIILIDSGGLARTILLIYTLILFLLGLLLIIKFVFFLIEFSDTHNSRYGSLFLVYIMNFLIPMTMQKIYGYVFYSILPETPRGFMIEISNIFKDIYLGFDYQYILNLVVLVSLLIMFIFTLISVRTKS